MTPEPTDDDRATIEVLAYIHAHGGWADFDDVRRDVFAGQYGRAGAIVRHLRMSHLIDHRPNGELHIRP